MKESATDLVIQFYYQIIRGDYNERHSILVVTRKEKILGVSDYRFGWIPCDENGKELEDVL